MTTLYKTIAAFVLVFSLIAGLYLYGHNKGYAERGAEVDAANAQALQEANQRTTKAEVQHDKDTRTINKLAADARRVQIHIPTNCPASGGEASDRAAGVLSSRVDEEFAKLQSRASELFERCDQINIETIRLNHSLP